MDLMRRTLFWAAAVPAAALLASCSEGGHTVTVANDTDLDRTCETVEICQSSIADVCLDSVMVVDETGKAVAVQVYTDHAGNTKLLFQATVPAQSEKVYSIVEGTPETYPVQAYSRYVPERLDD